MSKALVLGAAALALSAAAASAQAVYPGYGYPPYGYGYAAPAPLYDYAASPYGSAPAYTYDYTPPGSWARGIGAAAVMGGNGNCRTADHGERIQWQRIELHERDWRS